MAEGMHVVYQLGTTDELHRDEETQAKITEFLKAHGIGALIIGTTIYVRVRPDASLWVHTRQALDGYPLCEHCEFCVKTEPVEVPLVAAPPDLPEAYIDRAVLAARGFAKEVRDDG